MRLERGLVHVYSGNGKGKTSAALGLALRAAGRGLQVLIVQFMKGPSYKYGEEASLSYVPNIKLARFGTDHFVDPKNVAREDVEAAQQGFALLREGVLSGTYDVVIADEINVAVAFGLLKEEDVLELIRQKPEHVELVLTGRYATEALREQADYLTEFVELRHPFQRGISARPGIDY
ncbi:cob(I)yrinic acid a,c-diamide adenosyltransferase [Coprothermobacteraceae bacterium]|nr:cob(I)yrinic acid a,c-diamide adenosyltransferase [Coprothermobacteraceae bacterium]